MEAIQETPVEQQSVLETISNTNDPQPVDQTVGTASVLENAKTPEGSGGDGQVHLNENVEAITLDAIKLPKGETLDEALGKSFLDIMNDGKLSRAELAQKLVDLNSSIQGKFLEAQKAASEAAAAKLDEEMAKEDMEWAKSCMNDLEYGGDKWEASQVLIAKGRDMLASKELVDFFVKSKLGNNPEIIRMFYRAGKLFEEDRALRGEVSRPPVNLANVAWGQLTKDEFKS